MSKDIHEVQMDVMEWVEIGDLKEMIRHTHEQENERKIAIQADTLNAVVLAPMHPIVNRFIPFTTRQIAAKSCKFFSNSFVSG